MKYNAGVQLNTTFNQSIIYSKLEHGYAYCDLNNKCRSCEQSDDFGFESQLQILKGKVRIAQIDNNQQFRNSFTHEG